MRIANAEGLRLIGAFDLSAEAATPGQPGRVLDSAVVNRGGRSCDRPAIFDWWRKMLATGLVHSVTMVCLGAGYRIRAGEASSKGAHAQRPVHT